MRYIILVSIIWMNQIYADDQQTSAYIPPQYKYPKIVGDIFNFSDQTSIDDSIGIRKFEIPYGLTGPIELAAAYQSYFPDQNDRNKIEGLANQDAGFSEMFQLELGSFKQWKSIKVHVGEFAQDYCGENIDIVYTLDSKTVTVMFFDNSNRDLILSKAHCPHFPGYLNDGTETPPVGIDISKAFSHFCSERSSCIQEFFKKQANRKKLQSSFINVARELKIE